MCIDEVIRLGIFIGAFCGGEKPKGPIKKKKTFVVKVRTKLKVILFVFFFFFFFCEVILAEDSGTKP